MTPSSEVTFPNALSWDNLLNVHSFFQFLLLSPQPPSRLGFYFCLALPGGPGTIEEISEVISAVRIGIFSKPCVIYNLNGYYDPLREMYDRMTACGFLTAAERNRFVFAESMDENSYAVCNVAVGTSLLRLMF